MAISTDNAKINFLRSERVGLRTGRRRTGQTGANQRLAKELVGRLAGTKSTELVKGEEQKQSAGEIETNKPNKHDCGWCSWHCVACWCSATAAENGSLDDILARFQHQLGRCLAPVAASPSGLIDVAKYTASNLQCTYMPRDHWPRAHRIFDPIVG